LARERGERAAAVKVAEDLAALGAALAGEAAQVGRRRLAELVEAFERNVIVQALVRHRGALPAVARELDIAPGELDHKIHHHALGPLLPALWRRGKPAGAPKLGRLVQVTVIAGEEPRRRGRKLKPEPPSG
jgi:hypothetical protein